MYVFKTTPACRKWAFQKKDMKNASAKRTEKNAWGSHGNAGKAAKQSDSRIYQVQHRNADGWQWKTRDNRRMCNRKRRNGHTNLNA